MCHEIGSDDVGKWVSSDATGFAAVLVAVPSVEEKTVEELLADAGRLLLDDSPAGCARFFFGAKKDVIMVEI